MIAVYDPAHAGPHGNRLGKFTFPKSIETHNVFCYCLFKTYKNTMLFTTLRGSRIARFSQISKNTCFVYAKLTFVQAIGLWFGPLCVCQTNHSSRDGFPFFFGWRELPDRKPDCSEKVRFGRIRKQNRHGRTHYRNIIEA